MYFPTSEANPQSHPDILVLWLLASFGGESCVLHCWKSWKNTPAWQTPPVQTRMDFSFDNLSLCPNRISLWNGIKSWGIYIDQLYLFGAGESLVSAPVGRRGVVQDFWHLGPQLQGATFMYRGVSGSSAFLNPNDRPDVQGWAPSIFSSVYFRQQRPSFVHHGA